MGVYATSTSLMLVDRMQFSAQPAMAGSRRTDLKQLDAVCERYQGQLNVLTDEVEALARNNKIALETMQHLSTPRRGRSAEPVCVQCIFTRHRD
jgi:hypothetical protein